MIIGQRQLFWLTRSSNAFNYVNRQAALHNISILCPALSMILLNTYGAPNHLFVTGQGEISSREGTTQGDPLAMSMYALATVPLIKTATFYCFKCFSGMVCRRCHCYWNCFCTVRMVAPSGFCWHCLWIFSEFFKVFPDC